MSRITRQSGITYLKTEVDISRDLMVPVHGPIRVFDLAALGIDPERFIRDLGPSFDELSWDRYTVAEKRVRMLIELFPEEAERLTAFLPVYYDKGDDALRQIVDLLRRMPQRDRTAFDHIRSYRRRSIAEFVLTNRFTAS